MLRLLEINELEARKKILVAQSDIHRQTMRLHVAVMEEHLGHLKKRFTVLGMSSAAVGLGVSLARMLFKRHPVGEKRGLISRIFSGITMFSQVKSMFSRFKGTPGEVD